MKVYLHLLDADDTAVTRIVGGNEVGLYEADVPDGALLLECDSRANPEGGKDLPPIRTFELSELQWKRST